MVYGKINHALSALFYEVKIQKVSTVGNAVQTVCSHKVKLINLNIC